MFPKGEFLKELHLVDPIVLKIEFSLVLYFKFHTPYDQSVLFWRDGVGWAYFWWKLRLSKFPLSFRKNHKIVNFDFKIWNYMKKSIFSIDELFGIAFWLTVEHIWDLSRSFLAILGDRKSRFFDFFKVVLEFRKCLGIVFGLKIPTFGYIFSSKGP